MIGDLLQVSARRATIGGGLNRAIDTKGGADQDLLQVAVITTTEKESAITREVETGVPRESEPEKIQKI